MKIHIMSSAGKVATVSNDPITDALPRIPMKGEQIEMRGGDLYEVDNVRFFPKQRLVYIFVTQIK